MENSSNSTILLPQVWVHPPIRGRLGIVELHKVLCLEGREVKTSSPCTDTLSSYRLGTTYASPGLDPPA
jgi:hypothetical protein